MAKINLISAETKKNFKIANKEADIFNGLMAQWRAKDCLDEAIECALLEHLFTYVKLGGLPWSGDFRWKKNNPDCSGDKYYYQDILDAPDPEQWYADAKEHHAYYTGLYGYYDRCGLEALVDIVSPSAKLPHMGVCTGRGATYWDLRPGRMNSFDINNSYRSQETVRKSLTRSIKTKMKVAHAINTSLL